MRLLPGLCLIVQALLMFRCNAGWEDAPVTSRVLCHTDAGDMTIEVHRDWAPIGADHFVELVGASFFTDIAMYRSVPDFLTQFGISDRAEMKSYHGIQVKDDTNLHIPITRGFVSYAGSGPNSRSTQLFISYADLSNHLGKSPWETPFARLVGEQSQATLDKIYKGYGDIPPFGKGPDQREIHRQGNQYVRDNFPMVTFIKTCKLVTETVDLQEADFKRELTEAPQLKGGQGAPLKLKVSLDERSPRPSFGPALVAGLVIFAALAVALILRPKRLTLMKEQ